jgi:hypothetical protein
MKIKGGLSHPLSYSGIRTTPFRKHLNFPLF